MTLTWNSSPDAIYRITSSTDLADWSNVMVSGLGPADDGNPDDADLLITVTLDLVDYLLQDEEKLFLRVEEE